MFSPTAGGQRAGKVALSLPTSLSSAATELISAWHLERQSCPAPQAPSVPLLLFWLSPSQLFSHKAAAEEQKSCPPCRSPRWPWGRAAGCWLCCCPQARAKLRPLPQKQGRPSLLLPAWGGGRPGTAGTRRGAQCRGTDAILCGLPMLNIKSSVLHVYMIYI